MYFIESTLEGVPCKVYFFKRWGTYDHPVKPIEPITYAEALQRDGYCRAWMCEASGVEQFVFFEALRLSREATTVPKEEADKTRLALYAIDTNGQKVEISPAQSLDFKPFYAGFPGDEDSLSKVNPLFGYSYRYVYGPEGSLKKAVITNMEGKVNTLEY